MNQERNNLELLTIIAELTNKILVYATAREVKLSFLKSKIWLFYTYNLLKLFLSPRQHMITTIVTQSRILTVTIY